MFLHCNMRKLIEAETLELFDDERNYFGLFSHYLEECEHLRPDIERFDDVSYQISPCFRNTFRSTESEKANRQKAIDERSSIFRRLIPELPDNTLLALFKELHADWRDRLADEYCEWYSDT